MIKHLAVITTENLPLSDEPCAGGGVRIWGLGEALRRQGIHVTYFVHEKRMPQLQQVDEVPIVFYKPEWLHEAIEQHGCEAALFEQWQPMTFLHQPLNIPIIVDMPGPLALEYYWLEPEKVHQHIIDKLNALSQADYFLCAHERQLGYVTAWLTWGGLSPERIERLDLVPFTLHEMPYTRQGHVEDESQFFMGGQFWPWHDREAGFACIAETLNFLRTGQIVVAGNPPEKPAQTRLPPGLEHPHITWLGALGFSEFIPELKRATVAVDLCRPTLERRLSSDLRSGTALWAGVPCLVTPDSPWADTIQENDAGWVLPYNDQKSLKTLVADIALSRVDIVGKRRGARAVSKKINDANNIAPLLHWLKAPSKRDPAKPFHEARAAEREQQLAALQRQVDHLKHENQQLAQQLNAIRAKPLFKFYKTVKTLLAKS